MKQNNFIKTAAAILLSVCTIFVITYFSVFAAVHAEHACESHNCSICRQLQTAGNIMKQLAQAQTSVLLVMTAALTGISRKLPVPTVSVRTPVADKVRMNH